MSCVRNSSFVLLDDQDDVFPMLSSHPTSLKPRYCYGVGLTKDTRYRLACFFRIVKQQQRQQQQQQIAALSRLAGRISEAAFSHSFLGAWTALLFWPDRAVVQHTRAGHLSAVLGLGAAVTAAFLSDDEK